MISAADVARFAKFQLDNPERAVVKAVERLIWEAADRGALSTIIGVKPPVTEAVTTALMAQLGEAGFEVTPHATDQAPNAFKISWAHKEQE